MKPRFVTSYQQSGSRPFQEDHVLSDRTKQVFVVADGFGGPTAGPEVSKTACEAVRGFLFKEAGDLEATLPFVLRSYFSLAGNVLFNAVVHANRKALGWNKGKGIHERGGASLIAGFVDGDLLALANVGACSAWLFRDGKSKELVVPRTYGRLTDPLGSESVESAFRSVPLMALGTSEDLEPEIVEYRVRPGDWVILHTDGFPAGAREKLLGLHSMGTPGDPSPKIVEALSSAPTSDNLAVTLLGF